MRMFMNSCSIMGMCFSSCSSWTLRHICRCDNGLVCTQRLWEPYRSWTRNFPVVWLLWRKMFSLSRIQSFLKSASAGDARLREAGAEGLEKYLDALYLARKSQNLDFIESSVFRFLQTEAIGDAENLYHTIVDLCEDQESVSGRHHGYACLGHFCVSASDDLAAYRKRAFRVLVQLLRPADGTDADAISLRTVVAGVVERGGAMELWKTLVAEMHEAEIATNALNIFAVVILPLWSSAANEISVASVWKFVLSCPVVPIDDIVRIHQVWKCPIAVGTALLERVDRYADCVHEESDCRTLLVASAKCLLANALDLDLPTRSHTLETLFSNCTEPQLNTNNSEALLCAWRSLASRSVDFHHFPAINSTFEWVSVWQTFCRVCEAPVASVNWAVLEAQLLTAFEVSLAIGAARIHEADAVWKCVREQCQRLIEWLDETSVLEMLDCAVVSRTESEEKRMHLQYFRSCVSNTSKLLRRISETPRDTFTSARASGAQQRPTASWAQLTYSHAGPRITTVGGGRPAGHWGAEADFGPRKRYRRR